MRINPRLVKRIRARMREYCEGEGIDAEDIAEYVEQATIWQIDHGYADDNWANYIFWY